MSQVYLGVDIQAQSGGNLTVDIGGSVGEIDTNMTQLNGNNIDLGSGIIEIATQRTTLATDDKLNTTQSLALTELQAINTSVNLTSNTALTRTGCLIGYNLNIDNNITGISEGL